MSPCVGSRPMRIGILGGTGPAGSSLARPPGVHRLRRSSSARGRSTGRWRRATSSCRACRSSSRQPARTATTPPPPTATSSSSPRRGTRRRPRPRSTPTRCAGKVVICMANALVRVGHEFQPLVPPRGSVAAHVQAAVPGVPRRRRVPPPAGQGARPPRPADRLRRADLRRRPGRGQHASARSSPRSPAAARSTPASCPTPRRSRRSPPCCCSSTCATRPASRRS